MSEWKYRKPEAPEIRGLCVLCGVRPQKKKARVEKYQPLCGSCEHKLYANRKTTNARIDRVKRPYIVHRKEVCEKCGFVPEHMCQLDVDHIDGNHQNNDPTNLQTLCANCHRLKTWLERQ